MQKILVVAPHPDDETLGCGGTLLKLAAQGNEIHWLIATCMDEKYGYSRERITQRRMEIESVAGKYGFTTTTQLNFPAARLDQIPIANLVAAFSEVYIDRKPDVIFIPFRGDVHTDHPIVFDAASSAAKWFRCGSIRKIIAYETLSETEFGTSFCSSGFHPNLFVDVSDYFELKLAIMKTDYFSELKPFPFPRSEANIRALATLRGATSGCTFAEAFMLVKEIL
ncbi:MAG: PIG-L deacetylase family protein [Bacillota bacterium]